MVNGLSEGIPTEFKIYHLLSLNRASDDAEVLYSVAGSAALTLRGNVLVWDPGEYNENVGCHQQPVPPISEIVGSPFSYALVARAMRRMLHSKLRLSAISDELHFPLTVSAWRHADESLRVLFCDTEEGFFHEGKKRVTLECPGQLRGVFFDPYTRERWEAQSGRCELWIDPAKSGVRILAHMERMEG